MIWISHEVIRTTVLLVAVVVVLGLTVMIEVSYDPFDQFMYHRHDGSHGRPLYSPFLVGHVLVAWWGSPTILDGGSRAKSVWSLFHEPLTTTLCAEGVTHWVRPKCIDGLNQVLFLGPTPLGPTGKMMEIVTFRLV